MEIKSYVNKEKIKDVKKFHGQDLIEGCDKLSRLPHF